MQQIANFTICPSVLPVSRFNGQISYSYNNETDLMLQKTMHG